MVEDVEAKQTIGKSDHVVLTWKCVYKQKQAKVTTKSTASTRLNYKRGRYKEMNDELSKINWNVLENMDVQAAWDFVKEKLHGANGAQSAL